MSTTTRILCSSLETAERIASQLNVVDPARWSIEVKPDPFTASGVVWFVVDRPQ